MTATRERLEAAYARFAMLTATHEAAQSMHCRQTQLTQIWKVQSLVLVVFALFCIFYDQYFIL